MDLFHYVLLLLVCFLGGFVQRVSGFGQGTVAMAFLPHFMPTHTASAAISGLISGVITPYNAITHRRDIAYKTALPVICAALISIPVAVRLSAVIPADIFKTILGVVLMILGGYFLIFSNQIIIRPSFRNGLLAGTFGGMLAGMFSAGGPPVVLFLSNATKNKNAYFATIQFYFCFSTLYATIMRVVNGIITKEILVYSVIGFIGCLIGNYVGKFVFDKLDSNKLKRIIYIGLMLSGATMLF